ncbi:MULTISPECIES: hormogonium polysaccharide biosynthesis glycosyltransferase HpsE [unclassified Coleofasciculus]|uniref:hormogonium polysaccharide biosynthesis glycosyltransferase HpsE n=1 Tax=unclassified Coleofasciculus TaxID=2692782 RepID=UPI001881C13F|nr:MULTISPECIES: hormogonium polysaccharide biosynthesis glycosyltransferase HpsE [unclassified Coleofasciculus]MBE9129024.1 glycosyltransferase family 2 protein [Coleofasciculus sp. LEGE 07081]MBE9147463.1 glycosyltransferase family 2 protein [Coleofasciculus sp. LEGE 07092]
MPVDFTVAICTYNGAQRLSKVLNQLRNQVETDDIQWEVLVINNNSTDQTERVVLGYQKSWIQTSPLRYSFEPKQGLALARQRAVEEAQGKFVGFLDDDNIPSPNWVASAYSFGQSHPKVGAYGSRIDGEFEVSPPENFRRIACLLALTNRGAEAHCYKPREKVLPPGAGLVVQKKAWIANVPKFCFLQGRVAGCKLAGEDLEALLYIQKAGWEIWYNPEMHVYHQIPHWRLENNYLIKMCRGIGLGRYHTRKLSFNRWQWFFAFPMYIVNDIRKIIVHFLKHRKTLKSDLVAACEMELYLSSLISPLYFLKIYSQLKRKHFTESKTKIYSQTN